MPMPILDPSRFFAAVLADPTHKLPLPGRAHHFSASGEVIDSHAPFFAHLLADGSLKRKPDETGEAAKGDTPKALAPAADDAPKVDLASDMPKPPAPAKGTPAA